VHFRLMRPVTHFVLYNLGLVAAETQTTAAERNCIAYHAFNKIKAAEVGVWHGVTTCCIAQRLAPTGILYAIDNYPTGRLGLSFPYCVARRHTRRWQDRIQFVRRTSKDAAAYFRQGGMPKFDFVFLDGDHSYDGLREDWQGWAPLIAPDGIVALHDSRSSGSVNLEGSGSVIFTRAVILCDRQFELIEQVDTLSIMRRKRETSERATNSR